MSEINLSEYGRVSVQPSPVSRMMAAFAADFRDNIDINLGVGYVNENTIPTGLIEKAMHQVIADRKKYRKSFNYGGPRGSKNLINSIKSFLADSRYFGLSPEVLESTEVIIGPSGATSILEAVANLLPKGIVITSDPVYYIYSNFLERIGYRIIAVPEDNQGLDIKALQKSMEKLGEEISEISFFYFVTVNNPTCTILSAQRRKEIIEIARNLSDKLNRKIPVFFDKAYENLIHDPQVSTPKSSLEYDQSGSVYEIYSFSKILAPALRIGFILGPPSDFTDTIIQRTSDIGFSAPLINQEIASCILDEHIAQQIAKVKSGYREKALRTKEWIDRYLGEFIADCRGGQAGFYYYLTFKRIETSENADFFKFLTRKTGDEKIDGPENNINPRVIYIPGQFCVHSGGTLTEIGKRQLRLSYGFEELDNIEKALKLMKQATQYVAD